MDQSFPPNSKGAAPLNREPKKLEQITETAAVQKKASLGSRFTRTFVGGDARITFQYVVASVIIPNLQELVVESASTMIERMVYGGDRRGRRGANSPGSNLGHFAYNKISQATRPNVAPGSGTTVSTRGRARHDFTEIVIASRPEADEVLERMFDMLDKYDEVSVADLYALTGIRSSHTDNKWGWVSLKGSTVGRVRGGGYALELPEPVEL